MRHPLRLASALALAALSVSAAPPAVPHGVGDLAFLSGSWIAETGPVRVEEQWLCPSAGTMVGMGRTTDRAKDRTLSFEYLRIETRAGGPVYVAQPNGGPATEFPLVRLEAGTAVFENPAHDFPKRIVYTRRPDGGLTARVEGNGPEKAEELRYRRAASACP